MSDVARTLGAALARGARILQADAATLRQPPFYAVIDQEVLLVTGGTDSSFWELGKRGQYDTAPAAHAQSAAITIVQPPVLDRGASPGHLGVTATDLRVLRATLARTDTVQKALFTIPQGYELLGLIVDSAVTDDAGTTATIGVGLTGTVNEYLTGFSVKTNVAGKYYVGKTKQGQISGTADTAVFGIYAETGGASTVGGPFEVTALIAPV